jgi:hypothetical protein
MISSLVFLLIFVIIFQVMIICFFSPSSLFLLFLLFLINVIDSKPSDKEDSQVNGGEVGGVDKLSPLEHFVVAFVHDFKCSLDLIQEFLRIVQLVLR